MFEESLLESAHLIRTQSRWPAFASFALQAAIAATIILIPILHPEVAPLRAKLLELTAPPPPTPPPPPPQRVHVDSSAASTSATPPPMEAAITQGPRIERTLNPNGFTDTPPPIGAGMNMGNNAPSLIPGNSSTGAGPNIVVTKPAPPGRVSLGVNPGILLAPIQPIYPPIAKAAHQEGTVIVHAIISKTGRIESANAVSGPVMLQSAALDAIRVARYRPYLLDGLPTEVDTTFSVNFRLSE